jgi:hypothetical protein
MAGDKQSLEVHLNPDQVIFLKSARETYDVPDESKVLRIILDYIQTNRDIHNTVFGEVRCNRCD